MKSQLTKAVFVAGLLTLTGAGSAFAQSPGVADHHPEAPTAGASSGSNDTMTLDDSGPMSGAGPMGNGGGMMMSPEMMQMMMRMMNSGEMPGMTGRGMSGMMSGTARPMHSLARDFGDSGMAGDSHRMDGMIYGMPQGDQIEMTPERVRAFVQRRLAWHGNPRLEVGEIAAASDGRITAEILTVDGSLVQKLAFNRYPGLFRIVTE